MANFGKSRTHRNELLTYNSVYKIICKNRKKASISLWFFATKEKQFMHESKINEIRYLDVHFISLEVAKIFLFKNTSGS